MKKIQLSLIAMSFVTALAFGATGTFEEADANGDNCVDKIEATAQGIIGFEEFAKVDSKCLNEEKYNKALEGVIQEPTSEE